MACFYPIAAWRLPGGDIVFNHLKGQAGDALHLPCGQCDGCRLERARQWAVRCMHEAQMHDENCFITLTYNDDHVPDMNDLIYEDFQKFMKRLRKKFTNRKIRFFMCGEYGERFERPHFHACLFGIQFNDRVLFKTTAAGHHIYTSKTLDALWADRNRNSIGFASIGDLTFESAGYVARYSLKKVNGKDSHMHYAFTDQETGEVSYRNKEFCHMSLKPGIGRPWFDKYRNDVYPADHVIINGQKCKPPKYYKKILDKTDRLMYDDLTYNRYLLGLSQVDNNTEERLRVRETVLKAKIKFLKRELS